MKSIKKLFALARGDTNAHNFLKADLRLSCGPLGRGVFYKRMVQNGKEA